MNDLFKFLRDLVQQEVDVIAAFLMGIVVATLFLTYLIYWLFGRFYKKKIAELDAETKKQKEAADEANKALGRSQHSEAEAKRKAKDRKEKIEHHETELAKASDKLAEADVALIAAKQQLRDKDARYIERMTKYNDVVRRHNKLVRMAVLLKKQVASLNGQAKLLERMQCQLWDLPVDKATITPFRPLIKSCAVIIALINLKGGVGKTTLAANIAATYCRMLNKRVLAIDLDFQASLTNLCLPPNQVSELQIGTGHLIDNLFADSTSSPEKVAFNNIVQTSEAKLRLLATSERFARVEEQAKAKWLIGSPSSDIRSVLRSALHSPLIQDAFDVIVIDCPPRWTTSSINAIACCDYVLIPTQLDRVAAEAVPRLLGWMRDLKHSSAELYGNLKVLGVVGNRAYPRAGLILQEQEIWSDSPAKCENAWLAPVRHFGTIIHDKSEVKRAANHRQFAALHPTLTPVFLDLVKEIEAGRAQYERS
jgi:cellulose biosynthesis protein BcsQ